MDHIKRQPPYNISALRVRAGTFSCTGGEDIYQQVLPVAQIILNKQYSYCNRNLKTPDSTIRVSISEMTTKEEIDYTIEQIRTFYLFEKIYKR